MAKVKIDLPRTFQFRTEIPVRIDDINYGGHVGSDAVLSLLQEARVRMLKEYGWSELRVERAGLIMTDATVVYKSEAFHGDLLVVDIAVADITGLGFDMIYRVTDKATEREVARAKTGFVFFDYATRKAVPVPDGFRKRFDG